MSMGKSVCFEEKAGCLLEKNIDECGIRNGEMIENKRIKIGIISDTWPSAECFLKEAGLYDLFDSFTFSYQLGVFKPDPKMYQDAIQKLGIPATNTFFVDDSAECLAGAAMLGITPIQIMKKPDNIQLEEALHINTLNELPRLLTTY